MEAELEGYEYQLSNIKTSLAKDPTNQDLLTLRDEVQLLVDLTKEALGQTQASKPVASSSRQPVTSRSSVVGSARSDSSSSSKGASSSASAAASALLSSGDDCMAKYAQDGKWYPARVTAVGGSKDNPVYSITWTEFNTTDAVGPAEIKAISDSKKRALAQSALDEAENARKRARNVKKEENRQVKAAEQVEKQKSWQSFAKKSAKKGVHIPGMTGESMFKTPDAPYAKVGVVGAGKGMTKMQDRARHIFPSEQG
ncbi:uncharacterized protein L969DRAFT_93652 [Mixia osmundae IAM 14324]|uniref:Tudor domain-containing protein n=1 Tax=Mixia osmundae (strain CBS 9802 / IAM 14324 / JCM 22182 / KY 12970) TaxID=764103 RepID=G7E971_MIXOS|nr:uncharacterized protein L969DRAFT_93652 [Mixia osmundae IAM 14324]KEI39811.1 hypothetical protein L969DRAFT_93652 [Mixia osmundae IAM 14324]GAA99190.1 hypothetical protein E5Q_05882 [Mixia osmundae IAM 14324]